jgi:16S rRNA C967 or C1407 C5-methylase (RsmB/RsmF family)/NOL1/NOP2/fmu family ribosome biogenesis protein
MTNSFPPAFEDRMKSSLKNEWEKFSVEHLADAPVSIRINPAKRSLPVSENIPWTAFGQYLDQRPIFTLDPFFHGGAYYVQEASSMLLEQVVRQSVDLSQPLRVLDLCAAPGGKSTHLLSLLSSDSLLISNEVIRTRASVLSENIQKWGYPNVLVSNNDPQDFQHLTGYFDLIVVDAPCSGEGLFRKDPDARDEWSIDGVELCAQRQRRILQDVFPSLKQNGVLLYCTCTYNEQENEDNLTWLESHHDLEPIKITGDATWGVQKIKKGNGFRCYPHLVKGEGFFIAAYRKLADEQTVRLKTKLVFAKPPIKASDQLNGWVQQSEMFQFVLQDDMIIMIPKRYAADIEFLSKHLRLVTKGTALALLKHEKLVPEHAAALLVGLQTGNFERLPLTKDQALTYLRKDNLALNDTRKGFALVTIGELPIGWANLLGTRINNLYPGSWRIRMGS